MDFSSSPCQRPDLDLGGVAPFLPLPEALWVLSGRQQQHLGCESTPPHLPLPPTPTPHPPTPTLRLTASGWEVGSKSQSLEATPPLASKRTQNPAGAPVRSRFPACHASACSTLRISYTHLSASCLVLECGERTGSFEVREGVGGGGGSCKLKL